MRILAVTIATWRRIDKCHDRRWHTLHDNDNSRHCSDPYWQGLARVLDAELRP